MAPQTQTIQPWHAIGLDEILERLGASPEGLSDAEALGRLERYGPNQLPQEPPTPWWAIALRQFASPLITILAAAAALSLAIGHGEDAAFILAVLVLNALIGGYQEWRAERSTRALQQLLHIRASVRRDGEAVELDAEEVVPGDVVALESGQRVPCDLRLLGAQGLEVDESLLTGESVPTGKDPGWSGDARMPVGDRQNMLFAGSIVARGRGRGVAVATGSATLVGQLALDVIGATGGKPPLLHRMERFTRTIAVVVLVAAVIVGVIGVAVRGYGVSDMFLFAVALAVSAIPAGRPRG